MEILKSTVGILGLGPDKTLINEEERKSYRLEYKIQSTEYRLQNTESRLQIYLLFRAAFTCFDWTGNGKISTHALLPAMRRAGSNPTEVEVHDILNKIDDGSGVITFEDFCSVLHDKESFKAHP